MRHGDEKVKTMRKGLTAAALAGALTLGLCTAATAGAAPATRTGTFYGTYQHRDGCVYLQSPGGYHYLLIGYTEGGNGGLYKRGGGFIAYPGWRIKAHGTESYHSRVTTLCTTWGANRQIKATSIYSY
jgi:hypothetical protein